MSRLLLIILSLSNPIVISDGQTFCPYAYAEIEALVEVSHQGLVLCGKPTSIPDGVYWAYNLVGSNLISGTDAHENCGERAWNDIRGIIFPHLVNNPADKEYTPILQAMRDDMHEACHTYWLDLEGW